MENRYKFLGLGIGLSLITLLIPTLVKEITNSTPAWYMFLLAYSIVILYIAILIYGNTQRLVRADAVKNK